MPIIESVEKYTREIALSDFHIHSGHPIAIRTDGEIRTFEDNITSKEEVEAFINDHLSPEHLESFTKNKDTDLAIMVGEFRFRANFYNTSNGPAIVLRKIETEIPTAEKLKLPIPMQTMAEAKSGLVLVTGPTGSGKSSSLAAMIDKINAERKEHIITIEDPIEFIHSNKQCIVSQREIGRDASSFAHALRAALREDPDIILVGEMRDLETMALALTAAETGHLVFGTLHTSGAPNTINRIIDVFPPQQQDQARSQLSQSLRGVITQRLFKRRDGGGRMAAFEIMICNVAIQNLIRENKVHQIPSVMQTARSEGMVTMERSIEQLVGTGMISHER